ncbi:MAG: hypothetical protein ACFB13_01700 [Kiloniellaceae bacterium]
MTAGSDEHPGSATPPRRWTWAAILVAILLLVPCLFVGGIVQWLYLAAAGRYLSGTIFSWVGLEIVDQVFLIFFPGVIQGLVCGVLSIYITSLLFKRANYTAVGYSFITVVACLTVLSILMSLYLEKFLTLDTVGIIATTIGTMTAAYYSMTTVQEKQRRNGLVSTFE